MRVQLMYPDKEWKNTGSYFGWDMIEKDLGLSALYSSAEKGYNASHRRGNTPRESLGLSQIMRRAMQVPVENKEQLLYRQEIMKDCFAYEGFAEELFSFASGMISDWDKIGRRKKSNSGDNSSKAGLITDIEQMSLFVSGLGELKKLFSDNMYRLKSRGFLELNDRIQTEFSTELQKKLEELLSDLEFYVNGSVEMVNKNVFVSNTSRISIDCGIEDGLKFGDIKLETIETRQHFFRSHNGLISRMKAISAILTPGMLSTYNYPELEEDAEALVTSAVRYVVSSYSKLMHEYGEFFEQLYFQVGFYIGAIGIRRNMKRRGMECCFPEIGLKNSLVYNELKEPVMSIEQDMDPVGNTGDLSEKGLVVITGANQGGKSTFLRSLGIAQVMMQCGLPVSAMKYESRLYPHFYTHFSRREDSQMNSGRLDEELRRISRIIDNIGEDSLILFNESFASTTEAEGSKIMYDIAKALAEADVRVISVTHLMSFAQKVWDETEGGVLENVVFMSAERLENGTRTYKIIPHKPELSSFGLELYDEILG